MVITAVPSIFKPSATTSISLPSAPSWTDPSEFLVITAAPSIFKPSATTSISSVSVPSWIDPSEFFWTVFLSQVAVKLSLLQSEPKSVKVLFEPSNFSNLLVLASPAFLSSEIVNIKLFSPSTNEVEGVTDINAEVLVPPFSQTPVLETHFLIVNVVLVWVNPYTSQSAFAGLEPRITDDPIKDSAKNFFMMAIYLLILS